MQEVRPTEKLGLSYQLFGSASSHGRDVPRRGAAGPKLQTKKQQSQLSTVTAKGNGTLPGCHTAAARLPGVIMIMRHSVAAVRAHT